MSWRPLLIAIGPTAAAQIDPANEDLELVDVVIVDGESAIRDPVLALATCAALLGERLAIICLHDGQDEAWWPVVASVIAAARQSSSLPVVFVASDPRRWSAERGAMLRRLVRHLGVSTINAPSEPGGLLRTALLPVAGLRRSGVTGFDAADLAVMIGPPSAGRAAFGDGRSARDDDSGWRAIRECVGDPTVSHLLVSIRCHGGTSLHEINEICARLGNLAPDAEMLVSTPWSARVPEPILEVGVIALQRSGSK